MPYTVQPGDTFARVAAKLGVTVAALRQVNPGVADINRIMPGQTLAVPRPPAQVAFPSTATGVANPLPPPAPAATPTATPAVAPEPAAAVEGRLAWGAKVSAAFRAKVRVVAAKIGCEPDALMACMAFESGETFSPSVRNPRSGATGLIQFMPATATKLGTSTTALAAMSAEQQLDYVARYFAWFPGVRTLEDVYMAILWPKAIGKPNDYVLFATPSIAYKQNAGLDTNRDGKVTKAEAAAKVRAKLTKGRTPQLLG